LEDILIKYFTVENFRAIKNESILAFDTHLKTESQSEAHPLIGLAGANASGKTALLQAISDVFWFMQHSFLTQAPDEEIPINAFCTQTHLPTRFHLIFSHNTRLDEQKIDYEYKLCVNREKVLSESLHYYLDDKAHCAYIRQDQQITLGDQVPSMSTLGLRKNSSIISYAAQYETQVIAKSCQAYSVHSNLTLGGENQFNLKYLEKMLKDEDFQTRLPTFLQIADVGIETIALKKTDEEELNQLLGVIQNLEGEARLKKFLSNATQSKRLVFTHKIEGNQIDFLNQELESAGTLQFLVLLYHILSALKNGSLLIVDEIELKLHPNLVAFLLGLFQNPAENPHCAQLIFSFHNTAFMELLAPEQLWFAEKSDDGQTELFSAADFQDIKNLHQRNLENLYRLGRFGATPRGL
jgi:AAA15 family ATPase/GTPase